jgi:integrase
MARAARKDRGLLSKANAAGQFVWVVRLQHEGKERRFGSFKTKTAAREFYEKAKLEQKEGRFFPERYQTGGYAKLADLLEAYMVAFTGRSRRDETRFKKKWLELLPGARLNAVTPAALEKIQAQLAAGARTPQTVNRYMQFLRRVLNRAVRDGQLQVNPVSRMKLFRESVGRTRFLSPEEEAQICQALGAEHAPLVRLAILTGMRQMEQFSLRWEHVDYARGVLTLPSTKSGTMQFVRLNEEAKTILRDLEERAAKAEAVAEAEAIAHKKVPMVGRSPWVFPNRSRRAHLCPHNFYRRVYLPKVRKIGFEGVSWHCLRHTFASRLAMSGVTEGTIAALLRHSSTALVKRYSHLSPSYLTEAVEKVAGFGKAEGQPGTLAGTKNAQPERLAEVGPNGRGNSPVPVLTVTETVTAV